VARAAATGRRLARRAFMCGLGTHRLHCRLAVCERTTATRGGTCGCRNADPAQTLSSSIRWIGASAFSRRWLRSQPTPRAIRVSRQCPRASPACFSRDVGAGVQPAAVETRHLIKTLGRHLAPHLGAGCRRVSVEHAMKRGRLAAARARQLAGKEPHEVGEIEQSGLGIPDGRSLRPVGVAPAFSRSTASSLKVSLPRCRLPRPERGKFTTHYCWATSDPGSGRGAKQRVGPLG